MYAVNEQGDVVLTMSRGDFNALLMILNFAAGASFTGPPFSSFELCALTNRLNEGNPNFPAYDQPECEPDPEPVPWEM